MYQTNRGRAVLAVAFILLGVYLLAIEFFPPLRMYTSNASNWPLLLVVIGGVFLWIALVTSSPGWMIPAAVISGIGAILYWQNQTGDWASWTYLWTLIPGFVGIGILLQQLMLGRLRQGLVTGGLLILASAAAFFILTTVNGSFELLSQYWPVLLVVSGILLLAHTLWRRKA